MYREVVEAIESQGIEFIVTVPCQEFSKLLKVLERQKRLIIINAQREDEGIGIMLGLEITGRKSLGIFQDTLTGNSQNILALHSLTPHLSLRIWIGCRGGSFLEENPVHKFITNNLEQLIKHWEFNVAEINVTSEQTEITLIDKKTLLGSLMLGQDNSSLLIWRFK